MRILSKGSKQVERGQKVGAQFAGALQKPLTTKTAAGEQSCGHRSELCSGDGRTFGGIIAYKQSITAVKVITE